MKQQPTLRGSLKAYLYLLPLLTALGLFTFYPMVKTLLMSLYTRYDFLTDHVSQIGWANFQFIWHDPDFHLALKNTAVFALWVVPLATILATGCALLLTRNPWFNRLLRTIYFLPFVTSTVAISLVWNWLFQTDYGLINAIRVWLGQTRIAWLSDPHYAMVALISLVLWKSLGVNILVMLVGISRIDQRLYQVAILDEASPHQRFWHLTLPLLKPTIALVILMTTIASFKLFNEVFVLFQGSPGPGKSTLTVVFYLYDKFYVAYQYGIAAAASVVLFVILLTLTALQWWVRQGAWHD